MATVETNIADRVKAIFADARAIHAQALERLEQGDIRDAAEKAWCATKRATDALILAKTSHEPQRTSQTSRGVRILSQENDASESLRSRYVSRIAQLHGDCFYEGHCEPEEVIAREIKDTNLYIEDAEALAIRV